MALTRRFVGRARELRSALDAVLEDTTSVVIRGVPGVGKSALLAQLARLAEERGVRVASAIASSADSVPFAPLAHLYGNEFPAQDPTEHFVRLRNRILGLAADGPFLLAIDDGHLLDAASASLVQQLVVHDGLEVALAARWLPELPVELDNLVKDGFARVVELGPLERRSSDDLVDAVLDGAADDELRNRAWQMAEGHPLLVTELLHAGRALGQIRRDGDGVWSATTLTVPKSLSDLVRLRLRELSRSEEDLVELLAVAGSLPRHAVPDLDAAAALEARGLSRLQGDRIAFAHPLYGEEAAALLTGPDRRSAVERAVAALDAPTPSPDVLTAGVLSLELPDPDRELLERAVIAATQLFDWERCLALAEAASRQGSTMVGPLWRAMSLGMLGRDRDADDAFANLVRSAPRDALAEITRWEVTYRALLKGEPDVALRILRERVDAVADSDRTPIECLIAVVCVQVGRYDEAAAAVWRFAEDPRGMPSEAAEPLAASAAIMGRPDTTLAVVAAMAEPNRHDAMLANPYSLLFLPFMRLLGMWQTGRLRDVEDPAGPFGPLLDQHRGTFVERLVREAMPATLAHYQGRVLEARERYRDAIDLLRETHPQVLAYNLLMITSIHSMLGEVDDARAALEELDGTPTECRAGFRVWEERERALLRIAEGDVSGAVKCLLELADEYAAEEFNVTMCLHDVVRTGRPALVVDRLDAQVARDGATWWDATCAAHAHALLDRDVAALVDVARRFHEGGLDLHALEAAAQAADLVGDPVAVASARVLVDELLPVCGPVATPALTRRPRHLTDRELEVARLAAGGRSNAQIAERLGTSVRTVSNQLQHVYEKLGVHGRGELSVVVERVGTPVRR